MGLIYCKECRKQISQEAVSCPQCGAPQKKKSNSPIILISVFAVLAIGVGAVFFINQTAPLDDSEARLALAREILQNNSKDLIEISTKDMPSGILKSAVAIAASNRNECLIEKLAPKLAEKHTLTQLNDLKVSATTLLELTNLVTDNLEDCKACFLFQ